MKVARPVHALAALCGFHLIASAQAAAGPLADPFRLQKVPTNAFVDVSPAGRGETLILLTDIGLGQPILQRYDLAGTPLSADGWWLSGGAVGGTHDRMGGHVLLRSVTDGSGLGVFLRLYDPAGKLRLPELRVNDTSGGDQYNAAVAMNAMGEFVVAWTSTATGAPAVYAKRFRANGTAVGPEVLASSGSFGPQTSMDVGIDASGNFVITWFSQIPQTNQLDVWARRFTSLAAPIGGQFRVNSFTAGAQVGNRLAMNSAGDFIVAWESYGQDSASWDVFARRFAATGAALGSEFRVNGDTIGEQQHIDVALMDDGAFLLVWQNDNRLSDPNAMVTLSVREYRGNGVAVGPQVRVGTAVNTYPAGPRLALDMSGNYVLTWSSYDLGSRTWSSYAQRCRMDTLPPITELVSAEPLAGRAGAIDSWAYYRIDVPFGANALEIGMTGGSSADADLYVRYAGLPNFTSWDARPYLAGSSESAVISNIPPGEWYIAVHGYSAYTDVTLAASYR